MPLKTLFATLSPFPVRQGGGSQNKTRILPDLTLMMMRIHSIIRISANCFTIQVSGPGFTIQMADYEEQVGTKGG